METRQFTPIVSILGLDWDRAERSKKLACFSLNPSYISYSNNPTKPPVPSQRLSYKLNSRTLSLSRCLDNHRLTVMRGTGEGLGKRGLLSLTRSMK
jgi:hypothetical protein